MNDNRDPRPHPSSRFAGTRIGGGSPQAGGTQPHADPQQSRDPGGSSTTGGRGQFRTTTASPPPDQTAQPSAQRADVGAAVAGAVAGAVSGIGSAVKHLVSAAVILGVLLLLVLTNPSETDMRAKIARDGWFPVGFERTNLIVLNVVQVNGFTGAKGTYLGLFGGVYKLSESK